MVPVPNSYRLKRLWLLLALLSLSLGVNAQDPEGTDDEPPAAVIVLEDSGAEPLAEVIPEESGRETDEAADLPVAENIDLEKEVIESGQAGVEGVEVPSEPGDEPAEAPSPPEAAAETELAVAAEPGPEADAAADDLEADADDVPVAEHMDLKEVVIDVDVAARPRPEPEMEVAEVAPTEATAEITTEEAVEDEADTVGRATGDARPEVAAEGLEAAIEELADTPAEAVEEVVEETPDATRVLLGVKVPPATATRLNWVPVESFGELTVNTPVLVVNGARPGKTLCLTAAVHGDELNGIEMIRRVVYDLDPEQLTGTVIGVPIVNMTAFRRGSRYLPDRRDLNRYFPGNRTGSAASRLANSFFTEVVRHCDALVDLHTGSLYRTNLPQLRADLSHTGVLELSQSFGDITVLNSQGHVGSLRAAAVRAGIPAVTMEAGEPMRLQDDVVTEGTRAIEALMHKSGMYSRLSDWANPRPAYYKSYWVRADQSGFLFSEVSLGEIVSEGEVLGRVTDPITNGHTDIVSPYRGRILGMALDQMVLPGFAAYHIGIQAPESIVGEELPTMEDGLYHTADRDPDDDIPVDDDELFDAEEE